MIEYEGSEIDWETYSYPLLHITLLLLLIRITKGN